MTRVLMTADTVGGVWTYVLDLVTGLAPAGVEVDVAVMGPPLSQDQLDQAAASPIAALHQGEFALEWAVDPWSDVQRASEWLAGLEELIVPDVIHLNGYVHAAAPWHAPTVCVGHSCVLSWWEAVHGQPAPPSWAEYRRKVRAGIHAAGAVVAPSAAMAAELARLYGATHTIVIPNGRDDRWVRPAAKQPLVLGAGRVWDEAKNIAQLDRVSERLRWPVVIAGAEDGAGATSSARHVGRLPFTELAELLLIAGIFVSPARYEPFGLAPLEAGLAGCALVLGDIPSLREVWGDSALYVDPDEDDALVSTIERLAGDDELRLRLARSARRRAETYSVTAMANSYAALYAQLYSAVEVRK